MQESVAGLIGGEPIINQVYLLIVQTQDVWEWWLVIRLTLSRYVR